MATPEQHGNDMATGTAPQHDDPHEWCLITPMGRNGDPLIRAEHVLDATAVAGIVFFAMILGDVLLSVTSGQPAYLTTADILERVPTAGIAFGLAFFFMWARARGLDVLEWWAKFRGQQ